MGKINLYLGDCMEAMKSMKENEYDLAIVDPPYRETNRPTKGMRQKINGKMQNFGSKPNNLYFQLLFNVSENQIVWGGNNFISDLYNTNCFLFWFKNNPSPNYSDGEMAWTSFNSVARCINMPFFGSHTYDNYRIHPTQKPVKLYEWLLMNYAKPNQKILDTHGGSMSIALAVHNVNERDGMNLSLDLWEIDEDYYKAGVQRYENHIKQMTIFS